MRTRCVALPSPVQDFGLDMAQYDADLTKATGSGEETEDFASKLNRVVQLTGFSDPVYAEAYVQVHQFDINLGACRRQTSTRPARLRHAQMSSSSIRRWTRCRI